MCHDKDIFLYRAKNDMLIVELFYFNLRFGLAQERRGTMVQTYFNTIEYIPSPETPTASHWLCDVCTQW